MMTYLDGPKGCFVHTLASGTTSTPVRELISRIRAEWAAIHAEEGVTFLFILVMLTTAAHPNTRRFTPLVLPAAL